MSRQLDVEHREAELHQVEEGRRTNMSMTQPCLMSDDQTLRTLSPCRWLCAFLVRSGGGEARGMWVRFQCTTSRSLIPATARVLRPDSRDEATWWTAQFVPVREAFEAIVGEARIPPAVAPAFTGNPEVDAAMFSTGTLTIEILGDTAVPEGEYEVEVALSPVSNMANCRRMKRTIVVDEAAYRSDQLGEYE